MSKRHLNEGGKDLCHVKEHYGQKEEQVQGPEAVASL